MNKDSPDNLPETPNREPAITPLGTPHEPPIRAREGNIIHTSPELAVGEGDVRSAELGEVVEGTSLWRDAWRRLLKNRLALFGMVVVILITIGALIGPFIIKQLTGITPDFIPSDAALIKAFPHSPLRMARSHGNIRWALIIKAATCWRASFRAGKFH